MATGPKEPQGALGGTRNAWARSFMPALQEVAKGKVWVSMWAGAMGADAFGAPLGACTYRGVHRCPKVRGRCRCESEGLVNVLMGESG